MIKDSSIYFIGVDLGTGGVRTSVIDTKGVVIVESEQNYDTYYPNIGWAEQNPSDWWKALSKALHECISKLSQSEKIKIKAMCVCATSSTMVSVDKNGLPLSNAMLWMDSRSSDEALAINNTHHSVLKYCGGEVSAEWLIPKILWLKHNNRELYDQSYKLIEQLDLMNLNLSGEWITSNCNATCKSNYLDFNGGWQKDFFKTIGFEDYKDKLILDVKDVGEPIGKIRRSIAENLGISPDIMVVQGGIDAHIAILGLGVATGEKIGTIMGTSFVHLAFSKDAAFQNGIWGPYHNAVLPGYWLLEGGQISAGSIVKWFNKVFNIQSSNPFDLMSNEAKSIPIGADGIVSLDFFQGNRTPYKNLNAKGVFYGLSLKHSRADIFRSILESVAFGTKNIIDNFESQGCKINSMVVCGGITKDPVWLQIIADVTCKSVIITENSQVGALGCCISAAVGMKTYSNFKEASSNMVREIRTVEPIAKNSVLYQDIFEKYLEVYSSLKNLMI